MKATLEFTLTGRRQQKHIEPEQRDNLATIRLRFYDELEAHGITLD